MRIPNYLIRLSDHSAVSRIHHQLSASQESIFLLRNYLKSHGQSVFFEAAVISLPNGKKNDLKKNNEYPNRLLVYFKIEV